MIGAPNAAAEADELWNRAIEYERSLQSDPDWQDKSRREMYEEVGRRLERHLGPDAGEWLDDDDPDNETAAQPEPLDLERATVDDLEAALETAPDIDAFIDEALGG